MNEQLRFPAPARVTQAAEGLPRRAWTVAEIEEMVKAGIIAEDERFELIGGEIVPMSPKGASHEWIKIKLNRYFQRVAPHRLEIAQETTLYLDERSFVEPDFCVVATHPGPRRLNGPDILLAIEIADSSLIYDLGRKIGIYAAYGLPEVWVINAKTLVTHVHRRLGAEGYAYKSDEAPTNTLTPVLAPELAVCLADIGLSPIADPA